MIAQQAVEILKKDLSQGLDHILMARCADKTRANEAEFYKQFTEFNPVLVYSGIPKKKEILESIVKIIKSLLL